MICFQISIFEPLNTASEILRMRGILLWFAFKLVSLSHWIQPDNDQEDLCRVVICFQISIFEPLNTASEMGRVQDIPLWFAFKLVSLSHWIQHLEIFALMHRVVICFQISIFEPLNTARSTHIAYYIELWFAFKLVSLSHWIQLEYARTRSVTGCDLLSN